MNNFIQGYITGFFDAEGTVRLNPKYSLEVFITQSYRPVLESINNIFDGSIRVHGKEGYKNGIHRKDSWRLQFYYNQVINFLDYIYPYSIEKREQIEISLKYQKEIRSYNPGKKLSSLELEQRKWFYNELKKLKHEKYNEKKLKNYDNEIKKLKIPKEIREGTQQLLDGCTLDNLYEYNNIDDSNINDSNIDDSNINDSNINDSNINDIKTPEDILSGYLAGFFDGEGCISIIKTKNPLRYTLNVHVINTNFDILKLYNNKFGGNIVKNTNKNSKEYYKEAWVWYPFSDNIITFLKFIKPYTIVKNEQIEYAIKFKEWYSKIRKIKTSDQIQISEKYYIKLRELKKETGKITYDNNSTDNSYDTYKQTLDNKQMTIMI